MKTTLIGLTLVCGLSACNSPQDTAVAEQQHKQLYNAVNQPLEKARDAEQQIFDNAASQKKQADEI